MRKVNRLSFKELMEKNKEELMNNQKELNKIKDKLEEKLEKMVKN